MKTSGACAGVGCVGRWALEGMGIGIERGMGGCEGGCEGVCEGGCKGVCRTYEIR
jgi:hypothetical protein